jgi:hypothetical protein
MSGKIHAYLANDHARLDRLLQCAAGRPGFIDALAYAEFRVGLLKHISMEEKILIPAAERLRGGKRLPMGAKLRLDHGALTSLLVPSPSSGVIAAIRAILAAHNPIEEGRGGLYETCEQLAAVETDEILARLMAAPEVRVLPHNDGPGVFDAMRRALARAGYRVEDFISP